MVNRQVNRRDKNARGGFEYKPSDPKKVKERSENTGSQFETIFNKGIDSWRPKVGDNQIRICPPTYKDHEHYGYEVWVHSYVGAESATYLCLKKMLGKKCPICTAAKEAADAGEGDEAKQLKANNKFLYWIIDREGDSQLPQVWMVSRQMDGEIAALSYSKKSGNVLQIDHPVKGYDLMFKRVGQMLKTRYIGMQIDRERTEIMQKQKDADAVLEYIQENPLDTILKFRDSKFLAEAIEGTGKTKDEDLDEDEEDDDDEDDDDAPKKKGKGRGRSRDDDDEDEDDAPKKKRRSKDDDDDDDEDEKSSKRGRGRDDDDDDDDDDDKPAKKKKRQSRDDDDEDEDDDEDDKPKKKAKRRGRDEDDDDPADEDDDDSDDDEDDKPSKRVKGKSSSRGKKDDDEDDADDDEDEDDKPRKRRR